MDKNSILDVIIKLVMDFFSSTPKGSVSVTIPLPADKPVESLKFLLTHNRFCPDGIFGELTKDGQHVAYTLEHSYDNKPKLIDGEYTCVRGPHRLHGMTEDFITFEITGVEGHSGILFHWGNYNKDSDGCVLLGNTTSDNMVGDSRKAFASFMESLEGVDKFTLVVKSTT